MNNKCERPIVTPQIDGFGGISHENAVQLRVDLELALQQGKIVVVDFSQVHSLYSDSFRALLNAQTQTRKNGGSVIIFQASKRVKDGFELASFSPLFQFVDQEEGLPL